MMKLPLSLMLVLTQVAASSGSPLFLCLCHDGAVCIDFGPEACDCCAATSCRHESGTDADCEQTPGSASQCEHQACDYAPRAASLTGIDDDCGCTYVQISAPQEAVAARAGSLDVDSRALLGVAHGCLPAKAELVVMQTTVAPNHLAALRCSSLAQSASAVMRC